MKKIVRRSLLGMLLLAVALGASAQSTYIVKTNNAKKSVAPTNPYETEAEEEEEEVEQDFLKANFKYRSLCNWREGMRFMVMPEKYDLIVNTFSDAATGKEVGSGKLRYKIMVYKGHDEDEDGKARINFTCEDDGKNYYYEVPRGSFDDYCYNKLGVPTLAYLDDVDRARELLMGATLYTKTAIYRIDTEVDGDGYEEVSVPTNTEVKVAAIGVGSRSFPVKIIVEDATGRQFYQNVAMSRTNSGMRDDEFVMDNARYLFDASFELVDANDALSEEYNQYIGRRVYTRYATSMESTSGSKVAIVRNTAFEIVAIRTQNNTDYVKMSLRNVKSGEVYTKQVTFTHQDTAGDIDGDREDYYYYLFTESANR